MTRWTWEHCERESAGQWTPRIRVRIEELLYYMEFGSDDQTCATQAEDDPFPTTPPEANQASG